MIKQGIKKLIESKDLTRAEIEAVFSEIMQGDATPAQIASFITALRLKKETVAEITGAACIMRKFAAKIKVNRKVVLDTCGTGGSGLHTFNISTLSALVASAAGISVAKHGNRSVSSKCGSADLLEKLGVNINADLARVEECINKIGVGFLFAPSFHKAMKYAIGPRREIGIRTIFNILGPLTNPAAATHQLLGVYDAKWTEPLARVLDNLGSVHAVIVHGQDGLDEVSISDETIICELKDGQVKKYIVSPDQFEIKRADLRSLQINDAAQAAAIATKILDGQEEGPLLDAVILNSGFAIYAADQAETPQKGMAIARDCIRLGKAKEKLQLLIENTN